MSLAPGDKLGPFEILERIGKGGMGEVYRARDTRLKRESRRSSSCESSASFTSCPRPTRLSGILPLRGVFAASYGIVKFGARLAGAKGLKP